MDSLIRCISILSLVLVPGMLSAQQKSISYQNQQWFQYYQTLQISAKVSLLNDGGYRVKDALRSRSQYLVRTMVALQVGKAVKIGVGIGNWGTFQGKELNRIEIRPHFNFSTQHQEGKWNFSHRLRGECRFFRSVNPSGDNRSNFRLRYRIMGKFPLVSSEDSTRSTKLALLLGNELMVNAGQSIVYNVFDQNRILAGTLLTISPALRISLLYQHRFQGVNRPATYRQDYILWLGVQHKLFVGKR